MILNIKPVLWHFISYHFTRLSWTRILAQNNVFEVQLCRLHSCLNCRNSPETFVLHLECFQKQKLTGTISPRTVWELGSWLRSYRNAAIAWKIDDYYTHKVEKFRSVLSPELILIILKMCDNKLSTTETQKLVDELIKELVAVPISNSQPWDRFNTTVGSTFAHRMPLAQILQELSTFLFSICVNAAIGFRSFRSQLSWNAPSLGLFQSQADESAECCCGLMQQRPLLHANS